MAKVTRQKFEAYWIIFNLTASSVPSKECSSVRRSWEDNHTLIRLSSNVLPDPARVVDLGPTDYRKGFRLHLVADPLN